MRTFDRMEEVTVLTQDETSTRTLAGSCRCGAVTYKIADEFVYAVNCHCSICRRATGAAFKSTAGIERAKLQISSGRDSILIVGGTCQRL
jgi:hypothetical protein